MRRQCRGLAATLRTAFAEAAANRRALLFQMGVMILNDLAWIAFWVLFFRKAGEVNGWDRDRVILLQAVLTCAGGITLGVFANARRVGTLVLDGGLDSVLSLPTHPLAHLLVKRIEAINLGDMVFGVCLFAVAGHPTPGRVTVFIAVVIASVIVQVGFLVLTGSLAFFAGRNDGGDLGFNALMLLGNYPVTLFAGFTRVVLYSVVPAAFIATVPAQLIDHVDLGQMVTMAVVAAVFSGAAVSLFTLGLRRYSSGSVFTRA